jgi:thiosulfate/3-mercaptopyruvate sulfurtransferase
MNSTLLIDVPRLRSLLDSEDHLVVDCRFSLAEPQQGRRDWLDAHIPGAVYADLDQDLAAPVGPLSGRHPLPATADFAALLSRWGWREGVTIVAYDAQGGAFAARLWWLMRYFGQDCVLLLDGGLPAWIAGGGALVSGEENPLPSRLPALKPHPEMVLEAAAVQAELAADHILLLDARAADRFAGNNETIDPVAGHVSGARNRPFAENLDAQGRFHGRERLRAAFDELRGARQADEVVHMCGSGVTACHNQFAMALAGLEGSRLYPGSWSEWIRDPERPRATGPAAPG